MDLLPACSYSPLILALSLALFLLPRGVSGTTFTFVNKCDYTVWPGILANLGSPALGTTGFELPQDSWRSLQAPSGWSGRFWGRTGCNFDETVGSGYCATADCGSGQAECNGAGAAPPATLAEFTLGTGGGQDFYDVSLVDGYNLPVAVEASGGSGTCGSTGCVNDLNRQCPAELRVGEGEGIACRSACEAFGSAEYCCRGAYSSPSACRPSVYSEMFKAVCPRSYSYAYDDATSIYTCTAADYTVTFCPSIPSQKSWKESSPRSTMPDGSGSGLGVGSGAGMGEPGSGTVVGDGSWLAGLAMGGSARTTSPWAIQYSALVASAIIFSLPLFSSFVATPL